MNPEDMGMGGSIPDPSEDIWGNQALYNPTYAGFDYGKANNSTMPVMKGGGMDVMGTIKKYSKVNMHQASKPLSYSED